MVRVGAPLTHPALPGPASHTLPSGWPRLDASDRAVPCAGERTDAARPVAAFQRRGGRACAQRLRVPRLHPDRCCRDRLCCQLYHRPSSASPCDRGRDVLHSRTHGGVLRDPAEVLARRGHHPPPPRRQCYVATPTRGSRLAVGIPRSPYRYRASGLLRGPRAGPLPAWAAFLRLHRLPPFDRFGGVRFGPPHRAHLAGPGLDAVQRAAEEAPRVSICDETPSPVYTPPAPAARLTDPPPADTISSERRPAVAAALPTPAPFCLQPEARDPAPDVRREGSPGTQALFELLANPDLFPLDFCSEFEEEFYVAISSAAGPSPIDHGGSPSSYHSGDSCEQDYGDSPSSSDSQSSCSLNDSLPSSGPSSPAFA